MTAAFQDRAAIVGMAETRYAKHLDHTEAALAARVVPTISRGPNTTWEQGTNVVGFHDTLAAVGKSSGRQVWPNTI
jgi:hypothetical protein